jgi:hypothetical protein
MSKFDAAPAKVLDYALELDLLKPERVGRLQEIGPFDVLDGQRRLQRGDHCYTVDVDGCLAHYSWVQSSGTHPITEAGVRAAVRYGEFWIYHCRTADWIRGKRIYPVVLQRIVNEYFDNGYHTAWIYASQENIASQKGILRAGFNQVSDLAALRVGIHYRRIGKLSIPDTVPEVKMPAGRQF